MVQIKTDAIDSKALSHKLQMDLRTILPNKLVVARSYPAGGYPAGMAHFIPGNLFCVKKNKVGSFWIHIPIIAQNDDRIVGEPECLGGPYTDEDTKWGALSEIPSPVTYDKTDLCELNFGLILFSEKQSEVLSYDEDNGEVTLDFENVKIIPVVSYNSKTTDKKLEVINGHIVNTWMPSVKEANEEMKLTDTQRICNYKLEQKIPGVLCIRSSFGRPTRFDVDTVADLWQSSRMFRKLAIPYLKNKRKRGGYHGAKTSRNHLAYGYFLKPKTGGMSEAHLAQAKTFIYRDFHRARLGKKLIKVRFMYGGMMREVL